MRAVYVESFNAEDPAAAVVVGEQPEPQLPGEDWTVVTVKAASINHHDVFSLTGVALKAGQLPMILGTDAAGVTEDGREVVVHGVVNDPQWLGDEALDPGLSLFSEHHPGTLAERVAVPKRNLLPKPAGLSFEEAACLPTAWLTAYRMLFTQAGVQPGQTVLVQGSAGGLSTALITLAAAAGVTVWATGRSAEKRAFAEAHGAAATFEPGARLPDRVDAVMDSVGEATWKHSLRSLRKGGAMVVSGGTAGYTAEAEVARIFALNLRIIGSTMGTRAELEQLIAFLAAKGITPDIDDVLPLEDAPRAFAKMASGDIRGKVVLRP
ncbi:zinc-binding dehydrogenase [Patulibacter brassicae]|uniref:Zinc-binding dehydrogenase n=1 Tax=Patulibacter brassicae TaxID=1705717 RepID=A0ABU4VQN7_9ACTN|nr:zinc-binding dehydrogenase [Patulibacter brassicae]MDX8153241.1 zinc-binding dehydrogenase [Patulibacter brassicae]